METQTIEATEADQQQTNTTNRILQLSNYISSYRKHGREMHFLNLDQCLKQPYTINDIANNEVIDGISLRHNFLIEMPIFVSNYTNIVELNVSQNELNNTDFLLYKPLDDNDLTESYWDRELKVYPSKQPFRHVSTNTKLDCYKNERSIDSMLTKDGSIETTNNNALSKSSANVFHRTTYRPLVHPLLERVDLSFNHIKFLSTNIHYLRFLHTLNLSHNYLKELPNNIGYLEQLHVLTIDHNRLTFLPKTFNYLTQLEALNLSHNSFKSIDKIKNFMNLKTFSIASNPLELFPVLLHTCSNLEDISFSNTQLDHLTDVTFDTFHQFSNLKRLDLSNNNLSDNFLLLTSTKPFNRLEELYLQNNRLTNLHSLLSNMNSLTYLNLNSNQLTTIPKCFNSKLKILHLSHNNIELNAHECIHLKYMVELNLDHNQIKQIPHEFTQCQYLESLNMSYNQLKRFPKTILQLRSLNKLLIHHSNFQYLTLIETFEKYFSRTMNILDLSNNNLHTNLYELTCLKLLTYLDLGHNQLQELDPNFKSLSCLKVLKLNNNKFSIFPSWLCEMSNNSDLKYVAETLSELYLNDNRIESVPDDVVHMVNLQTIDLSNNQFLKFPDPLIYLEQLTSIGYCQKHGIHIKTLPDDFVNFNNLKTLDISHNIFTEVPNVIYNLSKLECLNMSYNLLTNIDTDRLKKLTNFKILKLNGNNFTSFPSALYQFEILDIHENRSCLAPPDDFIKDDYISATSNLFVQINDQYEERLFQIYRQIFIQHLTSHDIENLLNRANLSDSDKNQFRADSLHLKRDGKIELLLNIWKHKHGSLANADALFNYAQLIGDINLVKQMKKAYLLGRKIRI